MTNLIHAMPCHRPRSRASRALALCLLAAVLAAVLGGCSLTPRVDRDFGASVRLAKAQQTLYPEARLNRSPVNGLDAQAAKSAYDSYQKSYAEPEKQNTGFGSGIGTR